MKHNNVFFYCPSPDLIKSVPPSVRDYWSWINWAIPRHPAKLPSGKPCHSHGPYGWTVLTWMNLRDHGFRCELVSEIPDAGVILAHSDFWTPNLRPTATQFFVELKPDRQKMLEFAQFTVVQSTHDPLFRSYLARLARVAAVNNWPQPGLIRRNPQRSTHVQRAAFFGNRDSLISEAAELEHKLNHIGVSFTMPPRPLWNDYSGVDLIIAVRPASAFEPDVRPDLSVDRKPPNKLINAWLTEVPAILSPEPSYLELKRSQLDFISVSTVDEIVTAAELLKNNSDLFTKMVSNGKIRAADFGSSKVVNQWILLIEKQLLPAYRVWSESRSRRVVFALRDRLGRMTAPA